jgi:hypothetical protein
MESTHSLFRVASLWHSFQASVRCFSDWRGISILAMIGAVRLTNLFVILFQEINNSNVVFERHLVCLGEGIKRWHVASIHLNCIQDIFRQADRVQFEVCLE